MTSRRDPTHCVMPLLSAIEAATHSVKNVVGEPQTAEFTDASVQQATDLLLLEVRDVRCAVVDFDANPFLTKTFDRVCNVSVPMVDVGRI
jgi:hypothetical protein